jgi:hypothetical protein
MGSSSTESHWSPKTEFVSHKIIIGRVKFFAELKTVYFMGSEMQPGVMRAQTREIQIIRVKKILYLVSKNLLSVWNWKFFLQSFSKLILKLVIRFMNRKSSYGYATHFYQYFE